MRLAFTPKGNNRKRWFAFSAMMLVPGCFAAACSGTDGHVDVGSPDGGRDGTTEGGPSGDAAKDGPFDGSSDARTDGGTDARADGGDAGPDGGPDAGEDAGDAGEDAALEDAGTDAGEDGGSDASVPDDGGSDAGEDAEVDAAGTALVTGVVVDVTSRSPVQGATIAAGPLLATTDSTGRFALRVPTGALSRPTVTRAGYSERLYEELSVTADSNQGAIPILSLEGQTALRGALPSYDATLGAVVVRVLARGACASEEGATLSISPAGTSRTVYFRDGLPNTSAANVRAGEETSAIVYNVAVSTVLSLGVVREGCTMARHPTSHNGITRTGNVQARGGNSITTAMVFVE